MTTQHPIIPPPELVQQWVDAYFGGTVAQTNFHLDLAARAAQWGTDQELEACCELINRAHSDPAATGDSDIIRRALEKLND